ncbi:ANTAR domain-containing protein [Geodermatophilus ruber]|uniref:ANTAR domain-containing protein n=1 Tax=Geodermatophilus ruber TaxID=504800 RepID=A0A1I4JM73_9ACTN|nr:ANTAR domain-containing protein [Geodermatophilus ruber]SFL67650.1 ANTAR domain-containing protein [Geodermatophilus ruber]
MSSSVEHAAAAAAYPGDASPRDEAAVMLVRTGRGWSVLSPGRAEDVGDLVEGLSLADLVAEELGSHVEPDRTARRAARGAAGEADPEADPREVRLAALERTVSQLEHALAARVATERAIGVLAERHGTTPRCAFELLRAEARSQGRPVQELAREALAGLETRPELPEFTASEALPASRPPTPRAPVGGDRRTRARRAAAEHRR